MVALVQWDSLYKLRCLFKEVQCFDVLQCESAYSGLSNLEAVWMSGITCHFHGWLPGFLWLLFIFMHSEVFIWIAVHYTKCCRNRKWSVNGLQQVLRSFPLADLPACHPVGLMFEPSGLAVESCSSSQVPCMCQLCLPLTSQCEKCSSAAAFPASLFFICTLCVC